LLLETLLSEHIFFWGSNDTVLCEHLGVFELSWTSLWTILLLFDAQTGSLHKPTYKAILVSCFANHKGFTELPFLLAC
jgi:hypothetical protein